MQRTFGFAAGTAELADAKRLMLDLSFSQPLVSACLGCALAGGCIVAAGVGLRRWNWAGPSLSPRLASFIVPPVLVVMVSGAWWCGLRDAGPMGLGDPLIDPEQVVDPEVLRQYRADDWSPVPPRGELALEIGDPLPSMAAEGWLNGVLPRPEELAGKVIVVDIWNEL